MIGKMRGIGRNWSGAFAFLILQGKSVRENKRGSKNPGRLKRISGVLFTKTLKTKTSTKGGAYCYSGEQVMIRLGSLKSGRDVTCSIFYFRGSEKTYTGKKEGKGDEKSFA